jgi:hypothetical protein
MLAAKKKECCQIWESGAATTFSSIRHFNFFLHCGGFAFVLPLFGCHDTEDNNNQHNNTERNGRNRGAR